MPTENDTREALQSHVAEYDRAKDEHNAIALFEARRRMERTLSEHKDLTGHGLELSPAFVKKYGLRS